MKSIVKLALFTIIITISNGCASAQKWGIIKYPGQDVGQGQVVHKGTHNAWSTTDTVTYLRPATDAQFGISGSKQAVAKPNRYYYNDLLQGRITYSDQRGAVHNHRTYTPYGILDTSTAYSSGENGKEQWSNPPTQIPYETLPDRGYHSHYGPRGGTVTAAFPMRSLLGPVAPR